ncbi:uracil phosphoribosyltransferase-domain-containing protein [Aspergillus pseudoustus]|uniref:Uracil phosphoribosyltransferase-domain-containing protein n=1 Tax=Aspergillus pseudoustus TaxID=1810923 RepID=A0ABR4JSV4_9EURO
MAHNPPPAPPTISHLALLLEEIPIPHVQGPATKATGHQLQIEERTLIIAIMRAGESLAYGIHNVFAKARFQHANEPADITRNHIEGCVTVFLVDAVTNSGETISEFVRFIRDLNAAVRVVIVAGFVQEGVASGRSSLRMLAREVEITIVALRLSSNKYQGLRGTDTGNRLFNTVHLP